VFETFRNAWKVTDIRKKIFYTLFILLIYRIGSVAVSVPFLDPAAVASMISSASSATSSNLFGYIDVLTGGAFAKATIFALAVYPYINSTIIMQLLTVAIPALERMQKEGPEGQRKISKITRYVTIGLSLILSYFYYNLLRTSGAVEFTAGFSGFFAAVVIILCFTAGSMLVMWLGEQINEKGIGNGISVLIFIGIVARAPAAISLLMTAWSVGGTNYLFVPFIVILFLFIVGFIVLMTSAERRIPVQYAKRVVGRKMYGGQNSHIPLKVNMSGVMPVIFASSILAVPGTIALFATPKAGGFWDKALSLFNTNSVLYAIIYFLLIIGFNYFYVAIQYNPIEISNNLRKNNGGIPGIRPGKPTSDFISKSLSKVTMIGALFLGVIAILPIILDQATGIRISLGGTTILILVGVALDTSRQMESMMMMRHHKGFLE